MVREPTSAWPSFTLACMPASHLPDDIAALKRIVASRDETIAQLLAEISRLKRWQYGRSSERMTELMDQLQLALGELPVHEPDMTAPAKVPDADATADTSATTNVVPPRRRSRHFPAHLPRETVVHAPSNCGCLECGKQMRVLGEDVSEVLDYVPGYFKVLRHVRPKLSCPRCAAVVQEPAPSRPIARSMAGAGLLAQVVVAKYADHMPLYRQAGIYRRAGIELDRATLASWVREAAALLQPLSDALGGYVRAADKIHTDDTPVPVLEPGRGKTRTARLWTYVRDDRPAGSRAPPAVWYRYSPDRKGERPREHLSGYTGILQADAFSGYDALYRDGTVIEAGCWAHYLELGFMRRNGCAAASGFSQSRVALGIIFVATRCEHGVQTEASASMQIPLRTQSSAERYIARREWVTARLERCPLHPTGGCGFARHGTYRRVTPAGMRIARWYCPLVGKTFSLLPDFLAARFPGLLDSIDAVVASASSMRSVEAAADALRSDDVSLSAAARWLRRRLWAVQAALRGLDLLPRATTLGTRRQKPAGVCDSLFELRRALAHHTLNNLPAPLGFLPSRRNASCLSAGVQQEMGHDSSRGRIYAGSGNSEGAECDINLPIRPHSTHLRRRRRSFACGTTTVL
ncbi:IS66 family transposase [Caballeronia sp. LZ001]|uniref:IS66 family transposase n=2 Tax=Burkholderiaceae TaxID=119060 RepID=UPI0028671DB3|nr:IS66 family transposase [Caballeronia sp. LZ001]MDR5804761.1 IS66 family transposase [Caballeronia sp. LZ001]